MAHHSAEYDVTAIHNFPTHHLMSTNTLFKLQRTEGRSSAFMGSFFSKMPIDFTIPSHLLKTQWKLCLSDLRPYFKICHFLITQKHHCVLFNSFESLVTHNPPYCKIFQTLFSDKADM